MKLLTILLSMALTGAAYAGSTHTYNSATNTYTTVCELSANGTKLTFEYPNPAGSSNYTSAGSVKLVSSENSDGVVTTYNINATQLFLSKFNGPNSYGSAVSGLFVDSDAEVVLGLNSYTQSLWGKAAGSMTMEHYGVCLFESGE